MNFADKLKQIRLRNNWSQEELAEKVGVSRQAITKWETGKGLPDMENIIIISKIFDITIDELLIDEVIESDSKSVNYESETVYDIDCGKHFDIHMGNARKIIVRSGEDKKIHIKLQSENLENLGTIYKIKLDENKNKLDIDCIKQKEISNYDAEESVDILIILPKEYTVHCELAASVKELYIENLDLERFEYDGSADKIFIKDVTGSFEFTGKTDYDITVNGKCTNIDVNQWQAKAIVHLQDINKYKVVNKGRKCNVYLQKEGIMFSKCLNKCNDEENVLSISGMFSELLIDSDETYNKINKI